MTSNVHAHLFKNMLECGICQVLTMMIRLVIAVWLIFILFFVFFCLQIFLLKTGLLFATRNNNKCYRLNKTNKTCHATGAGGGFVDGFALKSVPQPSPVLLLSLQLWPIGSTPGGNWREERRGRGISLSSLLWVSWAVAASLAWLHLPRAAATPWSHLLLRLQLPPGSPNSWVPDTTSFSPSSAGPGEGWSGRVGVGNGCRTRW